MTSFLLLIILYFFKSLQLYIACAIVLTVLLSISKFRSTKHIFINSLILFLTLRLIFFAGTEFRTLPFIDTYWDFAVVRTYLDNKEISVLSDFKGGVSPLEGYSAWPLLHIFEYIFIIVTDIRDLLLAHILNILYIPLIPFIFTFLIMRMLYIKLALPLEFVYIASIFYATMPDTIYWSLQLIRNTLGWSFTSMIIFLILKNDNRVSLNISISILLLLIAIILSHHWSSIIIIGGFLLYLFSMYIKSDRQTQFNNYINKNFYIIFLLFSIIILIVWWINYSNIIFEMIDFKKAISISYNIERWVPTFPPELTPTPLILLLRVKMFLIYIPLAVGLYFIYKYYKSNPSILIKFIFSFVVISISLILFNFVINLEPTRVVILFIPFLLFPISLFYLQIYNRNNSLKLITMYIILPFITIISFIGIFSHSIIPSHLYSNLDPLTIGEHPTKIYINEFSRKINYSDIINIYSDDREVLAILLPSSQLHKIERLPTEITDERFFIYNPNRLIIIIRDFFVYRYAAGGLSYISYNDALLLREEIRSNISKANLLYTDSYSSIYQ